MKRFSVMFIYNEYTSLAVLAYGTYFSFSYILPSLMANDRPHVSSHPITSTSIPVGCIDYTAVSVC